MAIALGALGETGPKASAEKGPRVDMLRLETPLVDRPVKVRVWLPAAASAAPTRSIPWLLFLHDGYGSQRSFFRRGLDEILAGAIERGEVPAMAVVSPRTSGTFNSDDVTGTKRVETFLSTELVPRILERYPFLREDAAGRGVTGISMGGYGAIKIALRHPDLFGAVSAQSAWIEDLSFDHQMEQGFFLRWWTGRWFGKTRETSVIARESLFNVIPGAASRAAEMPPMLLISGTEDPWVLDGNHARLEKALTDAGIRFEARHGPGAHTWDYWRETFPEILRFHAASFD